MESIKEKTKEAFDIMKSEFHYKNIMQAPKIEKVVISCGVGSQKDKKKLDLIEDRLLKITGQKPVRKGAKISIAAFKVREGDTVGMQITLRGQRMYDFLDRLVNIALPRTKDFRGISANAVDEMGNYTLGIKENTIFPESSDEDLKDVFGLAVTIVTNVKNKDETKAFLTHLGFPFKKQSADKAKATTVHVSKSRAPKK
ncbi:MAG: 50S ribosomal protein L5 [Candidatus Zambryskibacteria bacterium RIFCSPLOWO2_12_FULL_39_45]|uniref:Large ribosomal subunit protein uL5 n=3 Tax=Candidatus Zambryskiibacteriota TaxID=1817925 RepID=A0A1G2T6K9_9BACT|nr:MAG: 50S ribosomal protein L5 [Parcubacteria group bacterium GW2011_GWA2_40_14]OHA92802.1 MAG: 50S ribosomal protein L5 [Candidatus Zambryskibacteria bacterium RIFCSPHIGHO2_02_38_10.5]OHA97050.1 MAG: 50S ribosomal protein L5 [Candidatus Zambryskibacteria bacterium RIFCSPHIGHO2_02_FULL_39_82]OHA98624.1 MAG: 50S ribosomal protein L5 [Candidatus Zambryskibacteria bacterium RIFCSPHIGHO2_12_FULL_38_37]OHB09240.1 MAG: 50S ribosomal protein L5 [Candidatus Zambryskibacteria bacterium RIFCSPLOWO2_02_